MTDPTEAIRQAIKTYDDLLAAGEAMPVAFNESGLIKFQPVLSFRALLDRLDSAERDQRRYQILRGNYLRVFMADKTGDVAFDIECEDPELNSESDGTRLDAAIDAALGDVGV